MSKNIKISYTPRGDTIFKSIFGDERNVNILAAFLRHVFEQSPVKIEFSELIIINPDLPVESKDERSSTVDILAKTEDGRLIDVEIQIANHHDMIKRSVYYASKMTAKQVHKNGDKKNRYLNIKSSIIISIVDFKIFEDDEPYFNPLVWYNLATNKIATDVELIYILELPKIPPNDDNKKLWTWLKFLKSNTVEEAESLKNKIPEVDQAMNIYKKYMSDEEYKDYIETRELMAEMDENERLAEAEEKGLAKGETNAKIEDVIAFAKTGMSLTQICQTLNVNENIRSQAINKLNEMGIKYNA